MGKQAYFMLLGVGVPACVLLSASIVLYSKQKTASSLLQLLGAAGFITVVLAHLAESFHILPSMNWGTEQSVGHYLDFGGAVIGLTLFPTGYLLHVFTSARAD